MQNAAEAYSQTAKATRSPRDMEADLLLKAASQLQLLEQNWDQDKDLLDTTLYYNRKLWTVFMGSIARPDNPLPLEIKNNIASLGAFILHHTLMVQKEPSPEKLKPLIDINREVAAGLHGSA